MMYSAYKLNKQVDNIQPWCTPFPILSQSFVPYLVLTVASWPAYRFHRRQIRWSGIPTSLRIFQFFVTHAVKSSSVVNEAEVDVFLEFFLFFYDPVNVGDLISGSSSFSKPSLYIWNFSVHVLLKPSYKQSNLYADFSHIYTPLRLQVSSLSLLCYHIPSLDWLLGIQTCASVSHI